MTRRAKAPHPEGDGAVIPLSFEVFVTERAGPMMSIARGLVRSDADAEDLLQDTLARALQHWGRINSAHDPNAYVNRMLINAATTWWRRRSRGERADSELVSRSSTTDTADATSSLQPPRHPGHLTDTVDDHLDLLAALRRLPVRQRTVVVLRFYQAMPDEEIAALLGIAPATVRSTTARALTALRRDEHLSASTTGAR